MKKFTSTDFWLFWRIFDTQIEPILSYGAEIWGLKHNSEMEKVQAYAMKRLLNVLIHASNKVLY